jgi:hypothetical protein
MLRQKKTGTLMCVFELPEIKFSSSILPFKNCASEMTHCRRRTMVRGPLKHFGQSRCVKREVADMRLLLDGRTIRPYVRLMIMHDTYISGLYYYY